MKILLDIKDSKVAFVLELLNNFKFVKTELLTPQAEELKNIKLTTWQKKIIDERLNDYYNNPNNVADFDKTIKDIEKNL